MKQTSSVLTAVPAAVRVHGVFFMSTVRTRHNGTQHLTTAEEPVYRDFHLRRAFSKGQADGRKISLAIGTISPAVVTVRPCPSSVVKTDLALSEL